MCGGGIFRAITRPVEQTISGLAGRRNHEGGPLRAAVNILPAVVGVATGNPWLAAAAGAGAGAVNGGARGAITGGLGSGVGAWLGNSMAFNTAQSLPALFVGKTNYVGGLTGLGAYAGSGLGQGVEQQSPPTLSNGAPINIPTFEQLRKNAVIQTQQAFDREGVYHLLNPFRRFNRDIALSDREKFPSLKKVAKERAKKRMRYG